jgi:Zn-dependent M28 family amino/carboxypeptidase
VTSALIGYDLHVRREIGLCAVLALAGSSPATTQTARRIDADQLVQVVRELASPRYEGRRTGTPGGRAARAYVQRAFEDIDLEAVGTRGFEQPFRHQATDAVNLVGRVAGARQGLKTIVVSAHYDHLGVLSGAVHPGADDNASGIAALLSLARYVTDHPLAHPVIFAAFDAEEQGLAGATAFLARPPVPIARMAINLNLDMLSRSDRNEIHVAGTRHYPWLMPILDDVRRRAAVRMLFGHDEPDVRTSGLNDWTFQSDHGMFHKAGVPFLYFGVEDHPDHHQPTDTADKIQPLFLRGVVEAVLDTLLTLDSALP